MLGVVSAMMPPATGLVTTTPGGVAPLLITSVIVRMLTPADCWSSSQVRKSSSTALLTRRYPPMQVAKSGRAG